MGGGTTTPPFGGAPYWLPPPPHAFLVAPPYRTPVPQVGLSLTPPLALPPPWFPQSFATSLNLTAFPTPQPATHWVADSGASNHTTSHFDHISSPRPTSLTNPPPRCRRRILAPLRRRHYPHRLKPVVALAYHYNSPVAVRLGYP
jgi:hypothetical protein